MSTVPSIDWTCDSSLSSELSAELVAFDASSNLSSSRSLSWILVLVLACSWLCSFVSSPRAHPCCWVCSSVIHHVVLVSSSRLCLSSCVRSTAAARECVILAPRAPNSHHLCNVMPRFHQGLGCLDEPLARPRADPHALLRTHSHVLRVSRALLATVSSAWSWIPPCRVRSTFGASASKVCIANGDLHLSSGFALLCFPRSYTSLLWFVVFCFGPRAAVLPKLNRCDSPQLSPLRLASGLMVSGHFSTQTCLH